MIPIGIPVFISEFVPEGEVYVVDGDAFSLYCEDLTMIPFYEMEKQRLMKIGSPVSGLFLIAHCQEDIDKLIEGLNKRLQEDRR